MSYDAPFGNFHGLKSQGFDGSQVLSTAEMKVFIAMKKDRPLESLSSGLLLGSPSGGLPKGKASSVRDESLGSSCRASSSGSVGAKNKIGWGPVPRASLT